MDKFSSAKYSMILESDMVFRRTPTIEDFFEKTSTGELLPVTIIIDHEQHVIPNCKNKNCEGLIWKAGAEYAFNGRDKLPSDTEETFKEAKHEYMHWVPFVYPNELFKDIQNHITSVHKKSMAQFFDHYTKGILWRLDGKSDKMSEFNIFG
jgi:hypothetical protein